MFGGIPSKSKILKVATYNISHCQDFSASTANGAPVDIKKYGQYIQKIGADIIALNEVYFDGVSEEFRKQTEKLKDIAMYAYSAEAVGKVLPRLTIGNAILSKYPIEMVETFPVLAPTEEERIDGENDWYEDRVVLSVVINVEGKKIRVIATHFGLNGLEQQRMIDTVCPIIDDSKIPVIFMGDFNAQPHTEILIPIYERLKSCADEQKNTEYTFSSFNPYMTIDYIFTSKGIKVQSFNVKKDILSDHRACLAEIEI